jgi:osmoprotectant transport system permease protein
MRAPLFAAALASLALTSCVRSGAIRVGSKKFTESVVLGELMTQLLEASGVRAVHRAELGGSRVLWDALQRGELDAYPEYTGTLRAELLPSIGSGDIAVLRAALEREHLKMTPLGFQDTYAIGMEKRRAAELGIRTLSDLARRPGLRLSFSNEFMERPDGWPSLRNRYGFRSPARGMDHDIAYRALNAGEIDATDLYSTDAEIRESDLLVLEDDLHVFPEYAAVILYRDDLPGAAQGVLASLAGRIDREKMIALNEAVKVSKRPERAVAAEFLASHLGRGPGKVEAQAVFQRIMARTREHLGLVLTSLGLAIAVAVPLGLLAARRAVLGAGLLMFTGAIQTVPSLALLVLMIPLLGIGTVPAIVALFLYSLLPILRGTHTGLTQIPAELLDSAEALGLAPWAKLFWVELPLAAPSICAGIKTAAVINVGTATLGALIGAGGYGQPILTGIRLADTGLILEGALPAVALAILVQLLFDLMERRAPR